MANSQVAWGILHRHGWRKGLGLGKNQNGIRDPIKVELKSNKNGVGYDAGEEFKVCWWDHIFNKTADSIKVKTERNGVSIVKENKISKKSTKTLDNKALLYGRFVKSATLTNQGGMLTEVQEKTSTNSDSEVEKYSARLSDEEIFKICGGRTGHRAARHGLQLNGKLQRLENQELKMLAGKRMIHKCRQLNPIEGCRKKKIVQDEL